MQKAANRFVLRRRMTGTVIAGSYHVVLGPVFWESFRGKNVTTHYGLTCDIDRAHRFEDTDDFDAFLSGILKSNADLESNSDFVRLGARADVSASAFAEWVATTVWLEVSVSLAPVFLCNFDGYFNRASQWTRELSAAHRFGALDADGARNMDVIKLHGCLVSLSSARRMPPAETRQRTIRGVNYEFDAHAMWSLWLLSLRFGFSDVKARRQALKHSAMAGWQAASSAGWEQERQFADRLELRQAFYLGCAFHRAVDLLLAKKSRLTNGGDGECTLASERLQASGGFQKQAWRPVP